jgi:REP element-mobilizing transposase RayT
MPKYDPDKHHRRSIRLQGYDYTRSGAYFVTICIQDRTSRFGDVVDDQMILNDAAQMVREEWERLPERFPTIELDHYVVMPNHIHGIILIDDCPVGASLVDALNGTVDGQVTPRVTPTKDIAGDWQNTGAPATKGDVSQRVRLGDVIGAFKSLSTNAYIRGVRERGWPPFEKRVWQRNYYERIIRNNQELHAIRQYIADNPLKWDLDRENPANLDATR